MVSIKYSLALVAIFLVICQISNAYPLDKPNSADNTDELLDYIEKYETMLEQELQELQELQDLTENSEVEATPISKRSDIDARLLEVRAKILMNKALSKIPHGHGKYNFHLM